MEVFEFNKCLLDRLEELMSVLSWKDEIIPACRVRVEWSYFIELQIEPTGWQALWKIPRVICEEFHIRYPTVVFGHVEQVLFKEIRAIFVVEAVQDGDVHLPERHEVALEDLWPVLLQENSELNIERTADCLDRLRFFYTHIWMPWDNENDDDINWVEKHLETRIRFCFDLRKHAIKRPLVAHIRSLLAEAKYLQQRREYLELGLSDGDVDELDEASNKSQVTALMRLHLRLAMIRNEIELLENPEMRRIYEKTKFEGECFKDVRNVLGGEKEQENSGKRIFVVILPSSLNQQIKLLNTAQLNISVKSVVQIFSSLQDVLIKCIALDYIYLSPGQHYIKFLENLNEHGSIVGICGNEHKLKNIEDAFAKDNTIITSIDDNSILLVFDGSFKLANIVLDCRNVRSGIVVKNGIVQLDNCRLMGDGKSSTQQGIVCYGGAQVVLNECKLDKFATGITAVDNAALHLSNTTITDCCIGLDLSINTEVCFKNVSILNAQESGIYLRYISKLNKELQHTKLAHLNELEKFLCIPSPWIGDCEFKSCKVNIFVLNKNRTIFSESTLKSVICNDDISVNIDES